ncbi:bifunctional protein-serine/threonine kinase/phosphatase [Alginatibacterium sediminis]|uniref:Bifunctional protein-serine/threonine kinase/phosphatase n=1 Tax=Alginatibacterium sediminis TaxID=2164068 RepID=A0A420EIE3_9ALTE|nr:bifunctional protein-serine/threonine kinase/phosphatase [Alginatibacterium sediminis]
METQLKVVSGHYSVAGRKASNQDYVDCYRPKPLAASIKGLSWAIADGVSSSEYSAIASQCCVEDFFDDYYATSPSSSIQSSAKSALQAVNARLYARSQEGPGRYQSDRGYVCTFSGLVLHERSAYWFHVGDSRIYRIRAGAIEQLTHDHRVWESSEQSYLSRAMGCDLQLTIDSDSCAIEVGDTFVLATDGVYEFLDLAQHIQTLENTTKDIEQLAQTLVNLAVDNGSDDNLSLQIIKVKSVPASAARRFIDDLNQLEIPPVLETPCEFDGYKIIKKLYSSARSHVYLTQLADDEKSPLLVLKAPSIEQENDPEHLERLVLEEWLARKVSNKYVQSAPSLNHQRNYLYVVLEYVTGQSLAQWMRDHPEPKLEQVRDIIEQVAWGLQSLHRSQILHQDLRPENIIIDKDGRVKIIDLGAAYVSGVSDAMNSTCANQINGSVQYTAPEYFLGEPGGVNADLFSLAVICYQMLSARLPYGAQVPKSRTRAAQNKLAYVSVLDDEREIPIWVDETLRKALHPKPNHRYQEISEFLLELRQPSEDFLKRKHLPIMERNPLLFWKCTSLGLALALVYLLTN